jgi:1A family penicillin-binding protein
MKMKLKRWIFLGFFLTLIILVIIGLKFYLKDLPSLDNLGDDLDRYSVSSKIYDRKGTELYEIFDNERRIPIKIDDLPEYVKQSTIAIEDRKFYSHFGFDVFGILRALKNNWQGKSIQGGSTITQQLVKNALLSSERSFERKFKELFLSILVEIKYSKKEILEMYLNYISYGGTAVGIESASQQYFGKSAKNLNLAEAAMLAGLPQAPSIYSPFMSDKTLANNRRAEVLKRMIDDGYINEDQFNLAKNQPLAYSVKPTQIKAPHFVFYVKNFLEKKYGKELVRRGGLKITTTLDLNLQTIAEASMEAEFKKMKGYRVGNGAFIITKPNTGEILSMAGSLDFFDATADGQVNVVLAERQPGSSIKPLVYAAAMQEKLINPNSMILDIPTCFGIPGQKNYCPNNYDGTYKGPVTIRQALANSLNIPAVKVAKLLGVEKFMGYAQKMGINNWRGPEFYGLSIALGGGEVRMIDLAQAFSVISNQGVYLPYDPILKITNYKDEIIEEKDFNEIADNLEEMADDEEIEEMGKFKRVMNRAPCFLTSHILQDNKARGLVFGPNSKLLIKNHIVSAKTGTTNDMRDNWTVGYTNDFLVVTWVGNNDNKPMNRNLVSGITGAAPIFNKIMTHLLKDQEINLIYKPSDVKINQLCQTGMPKIEGDENCFKIDRDYYWTESLPSVARSYQSNVWIDQATGQLAKEGQANAVLQEKHIYQDPLVESYCTDCYILSADGKINRSRNLIQ